MNEPKEGQGADGAKAMVIASASDFHDALIWALGQATARRARKLVWADPDFDGWPLDDAVLLRGLGDWLALPQRELTLLAADFTGVPRAFPRFTAWRRDCSHAVHARACDEGDAASVPTLLLDDGPVLLTVVDKPRWRGRAVVDARDAHRAREQIDALLQRSAPSWPVTTLGL